MIGIELMDFLRNWLVEHIQGADMRYKGFFNALGVIQPRFGTAQDFSAATKLPIVKLEGRTSPCGRGFFYVILVEEVIMSDVQTNEANQQEGVATGKGGGVPEFVILILKTVGIILGAVLLTMVVSFIMFQILGTDRPAQAFAEASPAYEAKPPVLQWYDLTLGAGNDSIRARTRDEKSVNARVSFGYDLNNMALQTELINQNRRWFDLIRSHISGSVADEIRNEQQFKEEIRRKVNQILANGQIREVLLINFEIFDN